MKVLYFTSTGNTLCIAKKIGGELLSIPTLLHEERFEHEDEDIGIVFPCYYFGVPRPVKEFVENAVLKSDYLFAVMSYGNMPAGALNQCARIAKRAGMNLSYLHEIVMIDNYLPLYDIKTQIETAPQKQIEQHLEQLVSDIHSRKNFIQRHNVFAGLLTGVAQIYYNIRLRNADSRFSVEDTCNSCQICEKVCPVNNIRVNGKPVYLQHCEECLACAHHCPQNAIRVKGEKSRARFRNEHVSLKEIIEAHTKPHTHIS